MDAEDLDCDSLILQYNSAQAGLTKAEAMLRVVTAMSAVMVTTGAAQAGDYDVLPCLDVERAVERLVKVQTLDAAPGDFTAGYKTELRHMLDKRLTLLEPEEAARVLATQAVVPLKMQLEPKKDGRKKARLVLLGYLEPKSWDKESNASPVAHPTTIKALVFADTGEKDVLSAVDVSVAFLQSDEYPEGEEPRFVSYSPYKGGPVYVFRLRGPIYGQRSAPRAWYRTLETWLVSDMGYSRSENDPCAFLNTSTGHRVVIHVDDMLCRGSAEASRQFYEKLGAVEGIEGRFQCKPPEYLAPENSITFTGIDLEVQELEDGSMEYSMSQERELAQFLREKGLDGEAHADSPMPDKHLLLSGEESSECQRVWARSVSGGLHYFSRMTRYDIAHPVSRVGQAVHKCTEGTVKQLRRIGGYLNSTRGFRLRARRTSTGENKMIVMTDSDHHGDSGLASQSQTGVIVTLNCVPILWRSNRQPKTAISPVQAEVYALSAGIKDARALHFVLDDLGLKVPKEIRVGVDSDGAYSFFYGTCPDTKLAGCFDMKAKWVQEMLHDGEISLYNIASEENLADLFTKCFSTGRFIEKRDNIIRLQMSQNFGDQLSSDNSVRDVRVNEK